MRAKQGTGQIPGEGIFSMSAFKKAKTEFGQVRIMEYQVGRDQSFLAKAQPRQDGPALCSSES